MTPQANSTPNSPQENTVSNQNASGTDLLQPEIQHDIPVKQHSDSESGGTFITHNPILAVKQFIEDEVGKKDTEMDHVLKDVSNDVNKDDEPNKETNHKFTLFRKKHKEEKSKQEERSKPESKKDIKKNPKPIIEAVAALIVAFILMFAALAAFKNNSSATKKSSANERSSKTTADSNIGAANASTAEKTDDVNSSYMEIQSKISALNDESDFSQTDLLDASLGL
jgi:hypothetical protein